MNPIIAERWTCRRGHLLTGDVKVCPICIDDDVFKKKPRGVKIRITCLRCFKELEVPAYKAESKFCGLYCFRAWMKENRTAYAPCQKSQLTYD